MESEEIEENHWNFKKHLIQLNKESHRSSRNFILENSLNRILKILNNWLVNNLQEQTFPER